MSGSFLDQGEKTSKVILDKVCQPSLGTSVPTVRTPNWSRPMGFYPPAIRCMAVLPYPQVCYVFLNVLNRINLFLG